MEVNKIEKNGLLKKLVEKAQPKHIPTLWAVLILMIFFGTAYYQTDNAYLKVLSMFLFAVVICFIMWLENKQKTFKFHLLKLNGGKHGRD